MPIKSVDFPTFEPVHFVFEGVCPICVLAVKLSENVHVFIEKGRNRFQGTF